MWSWKNLWSSFVVVAAAQLGLSPVLAEDAGETTAQPSASPPALVEALNAEAEPLEVKDAVTIRAYSDGPLVTWTVCFDADAASALINKQAASTPADLAVRWYEWYRSLNERLLDITQREAQRAQEELNLETDVSVEFCRGSLTDCVYTKVCVFRGSRCTYVDNAPPGIYLAPTVSMENIPEARVSVTIRPTRTTWSAREAISGTVIWENSGQQRVAMRPIEMPYVRVRREDGTEPAWSPAKMSISLTPLASRPPVVLMPGERHETFFSVETDPLSLDGAALLDDGRYDLYMRGNLNIPTECDPVRVEVRTSPDQDLSPRIIFFGAGGSRVVVVRENGDFEAYEIDSGRRVANGRVADYVPMPSWEHEFDVSPDGQWLALVRQTCGGPPASGVELFRLDGNSAQTRVLPLPPQWGTGAWLRFRGFNSDGKLLLLTAWRSILALDASTGDVAWTTECGEDSALTLDGRWRVLVTKSAIEFLPLDSHGTATSIPLGDAAGRMKLALAGKNGVYLTNDKTRSISYHSADGQRNAAFGQRVDRVLAEAPDAAVVAIRERVVAARERQECSWFDTGPIALWRADPPTLLWRLADNKPRQIEFTGSPVRVVCGITEESFLGVDPYSATFEVYEADSGELIKTLDLSYRKP